MAGFQDLAGKTAVVTGGASGIGLGIARRLKAKGMQLVLADIERGPLEAAAAELDAVGIATDVTSDASLEALAEEVRRRFGTAHVLCNNAGVGSTAKIAEMQPSDWQWILRVNLWGVIHGVKAFLPMLKANADGGHIVNTASMSGLRVSPGLGGYATSKFAVMAYSEALAGELEAEGAKVGVTVLCPGPVHTNIATSSRNRPASMAGGALADTDIEKTPEGARMRWLSPDQVGDIVVRAIRRGDFYALTHPEMGPMVEERHRRIEQAFLQAARLESEPTPG